MPNRLEHFSACSALELLENGVLVATITGPVTADAIRYFKRETLARYGFRAGALVADYRRALLAVDGGLLSLLTIGAQNLNVPTALIASPECVNLFMEHAARMALRRLSRRVFTEPGPAILWAASKIPPVELEAAESEPRRL